MGLRDELSKEDINKAVVISAFNKINEIFVTSLNKHLLELENDFFNRLSFFESYRRSIKNKFIEEIDDKERNY